MSNASRQTGHVVLWVGAVLFLALAAWWIPGAIWGTSENSPLGVPMALAMGMAALVVGLLLLVLAIRSGKRRRAASVRA